MRPDVGSHNPPVDFAKLFERDELASAQFYETAKRTLHPIPELRLMLAVLEAAVGALTTDPRRCSKRQRRDFADALRWVVTRDEDDWAFSFVFVCESLGIDPDYLRAGLIRKVKQVGETESLEPRGRGRCFSRRRKVIYMRDGIASTGNEPCATRRK